MITYMVPLACESNARVNEIPALVKAGILERGMPLEPLPIVQQTPRKDDTHVLIPQFAFHERFWAIDVGGRALGAGGRNSLQARLWDLRRGQFVLEVPLDGSNVEQVLALNGTLYLRRVSQLVRIPTNGPVEFISTPSGSWPLESFRDGELWLGDEGHIYGRYGGKWHDHVLARGGVPLARLGTPEEQWLVVMTGEGHAELRPWPDRAAEGDGVGLEVNREEVTVAPSSPGAERIFRLEGWPQSLGTYQSLTETKVHFSVHMDGLSLSSPDFGLIRWSFDGSQVARSAVDAPERCVDLRLTRDGDGFVALFLDGGIGGGRVSTGGLEWRGRLSETEVHDPPSLRALSPDGRYALVDCGGLKAIDLSDWRRLPPFPRHSPFQPDSISWDRVGSKVVIGISRLADGIRVRESLSLRLFPKLELSHIDVGRSITANSDAQVRNLAPVLSGGGLMAVVTGRGVQVIDLVAETRLSQVPVIDPVGLAFDADGESLFTVSGSGEVRRWEPAGDREGERITLYHDPVTSVVGSGSVGVMVVAQKKGAKSELEVFAMARHQVIKRLKTRASVQRMLTSPSGRWLGAHFSNGAFQVWTLPLLRNVGRRQIPLHAAVAIDDDQRVAYWGRERLNRQGFGRRARMTRAADGAFLSPIHSVTLSTNGHCLFAMEESGFIGVFDDKLSRLGRLFLTDAENWAFIGDSGDYAGSPAALSQLLVVSKSGSARAGLEMPGYSSTGISALLQRRCSAKAKQTHRRWRAK